MASEMDVSWSQLYRIGLVSEKYAHPRNELPARKNKLLAGPVITARNSSTWAPRLQHDKPVDLWKEASIEVAASDKSVIVAVQFPWWQFACCGKICAQYSVKSRDSSQKPRNTRLFDAVLSF